ncbi:hypothetical protein CC1G_07645 [Coprinopsis cinerea okayama7|uniref:Autophagy-related protein 11 n=1 Tax=Coprinopsis cinerea (strain Okayama-7 / 130 / ATCC MYA-4618 / FGSC 9003) TaxID=240176 RepID=A8NC41_COPC7|nr:hypothetical protein CC1G_07645 [Coprinopsis cinerea okayama7\|eukprot:XP_001832385.2 hypothetical protein CC1G_07645 [Coprinopsis cinerea okayama7\
MIAICTAENGQVFQTKASLRDIERTGSLEQFLHDEIGIDHDAIIAYISNGQRLTNGNLRELAATQDQTIFVFNKYYLDYDIEDVLRDLHFEPQFQPPMEDSLSATPPQRHIQFAASCIRNAHKHHDIIVQAQQALHYQHESLRIAVASLDAHVLVILDSFEGVAANAKRELERQATLLAGLDADLELINRVKLHVEFLSPTVRKSIENGESKHRTLGDYVSTVKMKQVGDACARTHEELKVRFEQVDLAVSRVREGSDIIRAVLNEVKLIQDADAGVRRSQELVDKIIEAGAMVESPATNLDATLQELRQLDLSHRQEVQSIADIKNSYNRQSLSTLRRISIVNNDIIQIPPNLAALQASFRNKNSFSHIQRLHNMLYAYGATVIEIVRRKEFSRFFYQRAQSILEVMAKLTSGERKRRQVYRSEVLGQLPFDAKGMDDPVPSIDFTPTGSTEFTYSLERPDVEAFLRILDDLEIYARAKPDSIALSTVLESRESLQKLVAKMDNLEVGFDKIAEKSLLSASRISLSRRRSLEADEQAYQQLLDELRSTEEAKARQAAIFDEERRIMQGEIQRFKRQLEDVEHDKQQASERENQLERELRQARGQAESESAARRIVEERNQEMAKEIEGQRVALSRALADATEQSKNAEMLRQELAQARAEFEEVKQLETRNAAKVAALLEEQGNTLRKLEEARARGEDLEAQIQAARAESDEVRQALKDTSEEKDRLLKMQASEHDRIIRDHIAEADGDRAVLERQFFELKAVQEHTERQVKDLKAEIEVANSDAAGLRDELQRVEHELRDAKHIERLLREDLKAGRASQSDYERRLEEINRLVAQILDVAISFRNTQVKALTAAQTMSSLPTPGNRHGVNGANMTDSAMVSSGMRHHSVIAQTGEPSPIDPSDPAAALEILREFDHDHFLEAINKTGSTIKKWQKQCKEYRERAKGKISFRNFSKGDLALFLPTRNSVSKPWAAFNVSFPHYFLQATGHLAEQLKTREWIVARITSITERVVDHQDASSNPYGLGDGVKYYMLEVEDWTQPSQNKRRVSSRKTTTLIERDHNEVSPSALNATKTSPPVPPPDPLVPEVEDTFHPTNSRPFPVRSRSNSSPTARPSSLSRLLAQASPLHESPPGISNKQDDPEPHSAPLPETSTSPLPEEQGTHQTEEDPPAPSQIVSPPPPSPSQFTDSLPRHMAAGHPSPRRPGSRASRLSSTSKFSVGRKPTLGVVSSGTPSKAAPTVALADQRIPGSPSSNDGPNPFGSPITPSPDDSISDALANAMESTGERRRTVSYHVSRSSPLTTGTSQSTAQPQPIRPSLAAATATSTLANLASSLGVFGRKRKNDPSNPRTNSASSGTGSGGASADTGGTESVNPANSANGPQRPTTEPSALALLGRF